MCWSHRLGVIAFFVASVVGFGTAQGEDWPQWRGPHHNGVSAATDLPLTWGPDENVAWRAELPGSAGSTPAIAGKRVFLTTSAGASLKLLALAVEDGSLLWEQKLSTGDRSIRRDEGNLASPSPVTDGKLVVALVGDGKLACFRVEGSPVWQVDLQQRYGRLRIQFGYASTPVLHGGRLYLQMIHGDGDPSTQEARVVCLELSTGKEIWARDRVTSARRECEHSYASPVLFGQGREPVLLTHGADYLIAHNLQDGQELWRLGGLNPPGNYHPTLRFVASPAIGPDLIVVPTAKRGPVLAVRPGGAGDISDSEKIVWRMPRDTPDVPSPLVADGLVYLCRENGVLMCVDAESGEPVYNERTVADRYRSSPVLADGKLLLTGRRGVVVVVRPGREFEILAKNDQCPRRRQSRATRFICEPSTRSTQSRKQ